MNVLMKSITLLGTMETRTRARCLLENHPSIRRIDALDGDLKLKLLLSDSLSNMLLLEILKESGIDGVIFEK